MAIMHKSPIHDLLSTRLTLDLGPTADTVKHIDSAVTEIKKQTESICGIADSVGAVSTQVDNVATQSHQTHKLLEDTKTELLTHVNDSAETIATLLFGAERGNTNIRSLLETSANDVVKRVLKGRPSTSVQVNEDSAPLVRLLVEAQTVALDKTPNKKKDSEAIRNLSAKVAECSKALADEDLKNRLNRAFGEFSSDDQPYRSKRFQDLHSLVDEIADHFFKNTTPE